jgi:hypothetical protein
MYMRVTRVQTAPEQVEAAAADFRERVMPAAREVGGYAGAAFFADRETGQARGVTYWQSSEALAATAEWAVPLEAEAVGSTASSIVDVERFRIVLQDRACLLGRRRACVSTTATRPLRRRTPGSSSCERRLCRWCAPRTATARWRSASTGPAAPPWSRPTGRRPQTATPLRQGSCRCSAEQPSLRFTRSGWSSTSRSSRSRTASTQANLTGRDTAAVSVPGTTAASRRRPRRRDAPRTTGAECDQRHH